MKIPLEGNVKEYTKEELEFLRQRHKGEYLSRIYKSQYQRLKTLELLNIEEGALADIKDISRDILVKLGYRHNYLYTTEVFNLIERFNQHYGIVLGRTYTRELISIAMIIEVLEYYNSEYKDLLSLYDIDLQSYLDIQYTLHKWCERYYWKPKILV